MLATLATTNKGSLLYAKFLELESSIFLKTLVHLSY